MEIYNNNEVAMDGITEIEERLRSIRKILLLIGQDISMEDLEELESHWDSLSDRDLRMFQFGVFSGLTPSLLFGVLANQDLFTGKPVIDKNKPPAHYLADLLTWIWRTTAPTFLTDIGWAGKMLKTINKEATDLGIEEGDKTLSYKQSMAR